MATSALGMGYDKPNLAFVVHFQVPGFGGRVLPAGRSGRARDRPGLRRSRSSGREDRQIQDWFINTAFPPREHAEQVVALIAEHGDWVKLAEIERAVNLRRSRLTNMLKVLEVEGVVERDGQKWRRTATPWEYPQARIEAVTARRHEEQERMREFLDGSGCLMEFLRHELDDPQAAPCGRCARCLGHTCSRTMSTSSWRATPSTSSATSGSRSNRASSGPTARASRRTSRAEPGRILSLSGDGGWGRAVEEQKAGGAYGDELVDALVELTRGKAPDPLPTWVTCVPSLRIPSWCRRSRRASRRACSCRSVPVVSKTRETDAARPRWTTRRSNSATSTARSRSPVRSPRAPAYLVDDIVDSRWTLTVVAALLRQAGAGPVFPLVLAQSRTD